jgi:hypothetical protein
MYKVTDEMIKAGADMASELMDIQLDALTGLGGKEPLDQSQLTELGREYYDRMYVLKGDRPQAVEFIYRAMRSLEK